MDSSSDEEETETDISGLDRGSTFLLGTTTRFGRQVLMNGSVEWLIDCTLCKDELTGTCCMQGGPS